jgi:hypothetical protein
MCAMADALRRILYPTFVLTIVATLWAMGSAQAATDQAYKQTYWPPLHPELFQFTQEAAAPARHPAVSVVSFDEDA